MTSPTTISIYAKYGNAILFESDKTHTPPTYEFYLHAPFDQCLVCVIHMG